ncbi:MAG TPA: hypothetical protein VGH28_09655 [Polyangiaceae bacterium]
MSARVALASAVLVGCASLVGVRDLPDSSTSGDGGDDGPSQDDATQCTPAATVLTASDDADYIATSGGFVIAQIAGVSVVRCAASGGCADPPNLLTVSASDTFEWSAVSTSLFYTTQANVGGAVHRTALDGTSDQVVLTTAASPSLIAASGAHEFWVDDATGDVHCLGCQGSDAVWISALGSPAGLLADANAVYALADDGNGTLVVDACASNAPCDTSPRVVIDGLAQSTTMAELASDGSRLYVAHDQAPLVEAIDSLGASTKLLSEVASALAVDAASGELFFAAADGTIGRVKASGGLPAGLGACPIAGTIAGLALDATNVYVLGEVGTATTVYAVPR